jgi:hypothetical protein
MIIAEIGKWNTITNLTNEYPFVFSVIPDHHTTATYWISTFLAEDETSTNVLYIEGVSNSFQFRYAGVSSLASCISDEGSYYWDNDNQILYIHFLHSEDPYSGDYSYQTFYGFSQDDTIYIDDQEFLPLIKSVPSLRQSADLENYNLQNKNNGSIILNNAGGDLDFLIDSNLYGNSVFISYIDETDITYDKKVVFAGYLVSELGQRFIAEDGNYKIAQKTIDDFTKKYITRSNLQRLLAFYIDDYDTGASEAIIRLEDQRSESDVNICTDLFSVDDYEYIEDKYIGKVIPIVFGYVAEYELIPINGKEGATQIKYICQLPGQEMYDYGTAYVYIDDVWTEILPVLTADGIIELNYADATDTSGSIRRVKLVGATGIQCDNVFDAIEQLNYLYADIQKTSEYYNYTEINTEKTGLSAVGFVFSKTMKLSDAIFKLQNTANIGFRYEIQSDSKRTLRIDNEDRALSGIIYPENIKNIYDINPESDKNLVYAWARVEYLKSYVDESKQFVDNKLYQANSIKEYKKNELITIESFLTNATDAAERAEFSAKRYSKIPLIVNIEIMCNSKNDKADYYNMRIFDIWKTALSFNKYDLENNEIIEQPIDSGVKIFLTSEQGQYLTSEDGYYLRADDLRINDSIRNYYGIVYIKILGIEPRTNENKMIISGKILPDYEE